MSRQRYFVVGDRGLNAGDGIFVPTLEAMRDRLVRIRRREVWTLVISIHGAEDLLATQGGYLRDRNASGAYEADDIRRIFARNRNFVTWRNRFGPGKVVLNACQVNQPFEKVILEALLRPGSVQQAQGLGRACRPGTTVQVLEYRTRPIRTRLQWNRIPRGVRRELERDLHRLNTESGYFGAPGVPRKLLLHYYFDEEPRGGWPVVRVTHFRRETSIPFYNRAQHPRFLKQCSGHIGSLPGRRPTVPPAMRR